METIKAKFRSEPYLASAMGFCGLMFFIKGVDYLLIGSVVPFVIGTFMLIGFWHVLSSDGKSARKILKILSISLILWGSARLAVEIMFVLAPVTEAHIRAQFDWLNRLLSIAGIGFGFWFIKRKKAPDSGA